ncbi:MAG TPA: glutamate--cysteine ligase [Candidatus Nitrosotenuis sp.]|jgi:glutamate--cysteine ligase|nr:glutamate--cysteine ligase [Candidatus Nitrosotenuis sp.]
MLNIPLKTKNQLTDYFAQGAKDPHHFAIGAEHERFLFDQRTRDRVAFKGERGIESLINRFRDFGWEPEINQRVPIAAVNQIQRSSLTLEPGGQFELSGAPLSNLHETDIELQQYEGYLYSILGALRLTELSLGFDPITPLHHVPWMPKERYVIMRAYMPQKGNLGLDMMLRTSTIQVNLDYSNERDMVKKFRVAMALQPIVAVLFATSPFKEGKPSEKNSYRNYVWQDTDPDRCGFLKFIFDDNMGYERYVDYLLDVPMYFVYRNGEYINAAGLSFRNFMTGTLEAYPHQFPQLSDWRDQTTIAFPEVRLKQYLELRGADCGPRSMKMALPALWVGLLYDQQNLDELHDLVMSWPIDELEQFYYQAPSLGLNTPFLDTMVIDQLEDLVARARHGLERRNIVNTQGLTESIFLSPLEKLLTDKINLSDYLLAHYHNQGDISFLWEKSFWHDLDYWLSS